MTKTVRSLCADDERAIIKVLQRYATGIDSRDWRLFRSCFSEDCEADYGHFGRWQGQRQITDYMRKAHERLGPTMHRLSNFQIEADDNGAKARTYVDALLMPLSPGDHVHRGIGWYDDLLQRTASGWKITRRSFVAIKLD